MIQTESKKRDSKGEDKRNDEPQPIDEQLDEDAKVAGELKMIYKEAVF
jgi:hypothetical protein